MFFLPLPDGYVDKKFSSATLCRRKNIAREDHFQKVFTDDTFSLIQSKQGPWSSVACALKVSLFSVLVQVQ